VRPWLAFFLPAMGSGAGKRQRGDAAEDDVGGEAEGTGEITGRKSALRNTSKSQGSSPDWEPIPDDSEPGLDPKEELYNALVFEKVWLGKDPFDEIPELPDDELNGDTPFDASPDLSPAGADDEVGSEESEETAERRRLRQEAEAKRLEELQIEEARLQALRDNDALQGQLIWLTDRRYSQEIRSRERVLYKRAERAREEAKMRKPPVVPWPRKGWNKLSDVDWFLVPAAKTCGGERPAHDGGAEILNPAEQPLSSVEYEEVAWCWRSDFAEEVLWLAQAHKPEAIWTIDLERAREIFKKSPSFAFALRGHREVVSLRGCRQLWSRTFIQTLEVIRKRRGLQDGDMATDVRRARDQVEGVFPALSGRRLPLYEEPPPKPKAVVLKGAHWVQRMVEVTNNLPSGYTPPIPEIPLSMPHTQPYDHTGETWIELAPPFVTSYQSMPVDRDDSFVGTSRPLMTSGRSQVGSTRTPVAFDGDVTMY